MLTAKITTLDWTVVALYFAGVFAIALWAIRRVRHGERTSSSYFLAGRNVGWFVVGASLFASNIGSEHLVGLAGTGAESGLVLGQFELQASLILLILGWLFVPFYVKSGMRVAGLTWSRAGNAELLARSDPAKRRLDRTLSVVLVLIVAAVMVYFSG